MNSWPSGAVQKLATGIPGFEHISFGGLPQGRTTLVSGSAGSAKTVFAMQFLIEGVRSSDEGGVFVTFEESPEDIVRNMRGFGWDLQSLLDSKKLAFVDATMDAGEEVLEAGHYDLGALVARIEYACKVTGAARVSVDSLGAVFGQFSSPDVVRRELHRMAAALKKMAVTAVLTAERTEEYGGLARFGIEEFVADNVIVLRNVLEEEKRRRTIEILKFRGTDHCKGEFPFSVIPGEGVMVIPLAGDKLEQRSSTVRVTSGNEMLDEMCGGGFFRDSIVLASGATGCGKTLLVTMFVNGTSPEERCLLFAFEESREQLFRNASGWGMDFEKMENEGRLKVVCDYPETMGVEDHLIRMKKVMEEFQPTRVAVDSLSALERVSTGKGFREFVIGITSFIKHQEIVGLFTSTTPTLLGGSSITEEHISTITDSIILLRYVEMFGEMRRGITVLKMRGSMHDKSIREYTIDGDGMHIGAQFRNVAGILAGNPTQLSEREIDRLDDLFRDPGETDVPAA
jgi:circadian clock protein KaiC